MMTKESYREAVSGVTHLIGTLLAITGAIWLILMTRHDIPKLMSVAVFGVSMVLLYLASTTMHLLASLKGTKHRLVRLFNRLDHAAIYLLIAGSYTPFVYNLLTDHWRWLMLSAIWLLALAGVVIKLFFFFGGNFSTAFYIGMGWLGVIAVPQVISVIEPKELWLIVSGGIVYTVGAGIFAFRKPNFHRYFGHHELWHLFVMAGSACHFAAVVSYVA
jgi:hemolysin III